MKTPWFPFLIAALLAGAGCSRDPQVAARKYLESGNRYFNNGKYNEASIMYRSALKKYPMFGEGYYRLGLTFLKQNNFAASERALRRAFELLEKKGGPELEDTTSKLSDIYLLAYLTDTRRSKSSEVGFNDFLGRLKENSFDRLRLEAYQAWRAKDLDTAQAKFEAAAKVKPRDPNLELAYAQVLMAKNRFEDAERIVLAIIERDPKNGAAYDVLYREYLQRNRGQDAERMSRRKSESNPEVLDYRLQLAAHYALTNQREQMDRVLNAILADPKTFPQGRERAGDLYISFREFEKALAVYRGGLGGGKEERLNFQRKIADVLILQGKRDQALSLLDNEILKAVPNDPIGTALRATLWLEMGNRNQLQQAVSELESAVSRLPRNAVVRYNLGRAYWAKGDVDLARAQFKAAIETQPDYIAPRLAMAQLQISRGENAQALQSADEILQQSRTNLGARLLRSLALQGMGKLDEARAELQLILKTRPDSPEAKFRLGILELRARNFQAAEQVFRQCLADGKQEPLCQIGLAEVYNAQQQYGKSVELLAAEVSKDPGRRELRLALANTCVLAKKYDQAMEAYKYLIAKEPESADLHMRLGETYRRSGNSGMAIEYFRRAKQLQPNNPDAAIWLALLLHQTGKEADAKVEYEQILRLQNDNPVALNNLAYLLAEHGGDLDVALTYAQRAKQRLPQSLEISDTLGWVYLKKNLRNNALEIYNDLVAKAPQNPTFRYHRAMALFQSGDKPQARKELESALRNNPNKEEEGKIREMLEKIG
ncbi:MAG: tetratricopeptide repeat protein [Bryobacterales bacterium]|nr:tetratricopeptide repeat protein [Bryobacterales bacterium]